MLSAELQWHGEILTEKEKGPHGPFVTFYKLFQPSACSEA